MRASWQPASRKNSLRRAIRSDEGSHDYEQDVGARPNCRASVDAKLGHLKYDNYKELDIDDEMLHVQEQ